MFCPNCGKDAGEFKFCPYCGTGMPELKAAVWSVGMPCPHCGGNEMDGDRCAFCGTRRAQERSDEVTSGKCGAVPWGRYGGAMGCFLELNEAGIVLRNYKKEEVSIRYPQLLDVVFREISFLRFGSITIRWEDNSFQPMPKKYLEILNDATSVLYLYQDRDLYYAIYRELKRICERRDGRSSFQNGK